MPSHQVLFCPFCRECFDDRASCPMHELPLVPWSALPPSDVLDHDDDEPDEAPPIAPDLRPIALLDPRAGRGLVALAATLDLLALALPMVRTEDGTWLSTHALARALPSLWTLGLVGFTALYVLARRRTPRALWSLRVLVPLLAPTACVPVAVALVRLGPTVRWGLAVYAVALAAALMVAGGLRLGGRSELSTRA